MLLEGIKRVAVPGQTSKYVHGFYRPHQKEN